MRLVLGRLAIRSHTYVHPGIDLADEDRKFIEYLAVNGWVGEVGEKDETVFDTIDDTAGSIKH